MTQVLVTGASGGIGAAISRELARRGCSVVLHYQSDRDAALAALAGLGGWDTGSCRQIWAIRPRSRGCGARPARALRSMRCINNAGIFPDHPPLTTSYADWTQAWQRTLAVNLAGPAHLSYCAARAMSERGGGRIVSVSSRAAFRGEPTAPAYAASKAGLNAFSQSLAKALAGRGVYVYVVAPGWVSTERVAQAIANPQVLLDQPLGRVATPEEVAEVVAFCALAAPASMTGAVLDVNGASYLRT